MNGALSNRRVLLIPSAVRGNGTGHLRRCFRLAAGLAGTGNTVSVVTDTESENGGVVFSQAEVDALNESTGGRGYKLLDEAGSENYDICIFDMRETPVELFSSYSGLCFCIGIDEGGPMRGSFDYLIDILPNLETVPANISSTGFLNLPAVPDNSARNYPPEKILVSFGGEDRAGLTKKLVSVLKSKGFFDSGRITVVRGPMFSDDAVPEGVDLLDSPGNLAELLGTYDLVFTMFGITCFEALHSGTPVILLNPSPYHARLAEKAGLPDIGISEPDAPKLRVLLASKDGLYEAVRRYSSVKQVDLCAFIERLRPAGMSCRFCGKHHGEAVHRAENRVFFECSECGLVNMYDFRENETEYGTDYFFDDYKKQYGRTYLEDFDNIRKAGMRRCGVISGKLNSGSLLDIGCGYGPFLAAASDAGFEVFGIDISKNAVDWAGEKLGFPVAAADAGSFTPELFGRERFSAVTMWYVIEHMEQLGVILPRINKMIEPGGVFAFSTPNYSGISGRRALRQFLDSSPDDHYTVWNPQSAEFIMNRSGFRVYAVSCPVIHPSRFFETGVYEGIPRFLRGLLDSVIRAVGRFFKLGDIFEVYCVKTTEAVSGEI